tara:strand:+ start:195 stop:425 length:231 start_codon:yes stop_codon:yes gene_type:complete
MFNILNLLKKKQENIKNDMDEYIILNKDFENSECIICLENMIKGERVKILRCGHIYHYKCIDEWFKRKRECPLCCK